MPPTYSCEQCNRTFPRLDRLRAHLRSHYPHDAYECGDCGRTFRHDSTLARHQRARKHSGRIVHDAVLTGAYRQLRQGRAVDGINVTVSRRPSSPLTTTINHHAQPPLFPPTTQPMQAPPQTDVVAQLIATHRAHVERVDAERRLAVMGAIMAAAGITPATTPSSPPDQNLRAIAQPQLNKSSRLGAHEQYQLQQQPEPKPPVQSQGDNNRQVQTPTEHTSYTQQSLRQLRATLGLAQSASSSSSLHRLLSQAQQHHLQQNHHLQRQQPDQAQLSLPMCIGQPSITQSFQPPFPLNPDTRLRGNELNASTSTSSLMMSASASMPYKQPSSAKQCSLDSSRVNESQQSTDARLKAAGDIWPHKLELPTTTTSDVPSRLAISMPQNFLERLQQHHSSAPLLPQSSTSAFQGVSLLLACADAPRNIPSPSLRGQTISQRDRPGSEQLENEAGALQGTDTTDDEQPATTSMIIPSSAPLLDLTWPQSP
eukprot:TRINITY_DN6769_c0_g1_i2.p1 TRINITY_DN6769_c0_g1~~TRINITY_DN6769_c0_g1_i2.p1  ORF type:complete len:484 (+),score=65.69 TRINITY_DN6769_c0_g1_i2:307-1758(+)